MIKNKTREEIELEKKAQQAPHDPNMIRRKFGRASLLVETVGWSDCGCHAKYDGGVVLDPMCGSGTTLLVARKLLRHYIGIELNPSYVKMAEKRLAKIPLRLDRIQSRLLEKPFSSEGLSQRSSKEVQS